MAETLGLCNSIAATRTAIPKHQHLLSAPPLPTSIPASVRPPHNPPSTSSPSSSSSSSSISLKKPFRIPNPIITSPSPSSRPILQEKLLFLESIGVDVLHLADARPSAIDAPLDRILSVVDFLRSNGFPDSELGRIFNLCPEVLESSVRDDVLPVFTFLLREVGVSGDDLRGVINRRPRLLACSVPDRLRPTLYFLQSLGIADVRKHTALLSCDAEEKFVPRLEFFQRVGFSRRDAVSMVRRFPPLFCYGVETNLRPKFEFLVNDMQRGMDELRDFPQYFSFSLENRIKPRHMVSVENRVRLPLAVMLRLTDERFREKIEVCVGSSQPLSSSPLWYETVVGSPCRDGSGQAVYCA
ncbi:transcription termination factor MTEF1, chloroplastic [Nymphaea colorata]|uniref:Uncharacterized protein n=1 Tax=Nymphaea colorata TaxID=210225 RepID=A0A5K1CCN9_9MAGN|nr:transcription termination factor MTEF1, chloroplastic [Nymphaea colorata]XP_049933619.1 transcription termination factor MTEF1, chloroplastic [Nymphaea colorata]